MPTLSELTQTHDELPHYRQLLSVWSRFQGRWPTSTHELGKGSLLYAVCLAFCFKGQTEYPDVDQVDELLAALRHCTELDPSNERNCEAALARLDRLPGIGLPRASTILHCFHPEDFPIVDRNAADALCKWARRGVGWPDEVPSPTSTHTDMTQDEKAYLEYRRTLLALAAQSDLTLRQVEFSLYNAGRLQQPVTGL